MPDNRQVKCVTTAIILYARGLAYSALGQIDGAEAAQQEFELARAAVPESRLNSIPCKQVDVLKVASAMLHGELEYRRGKYDVAFASLREAIRHEDALPYCDPPAWMQPVRHALGGLLLEQNRVEEAEVLFREDLGFAIGFPRRKAKLNNVWGLYGLHEFLTRHGKTDELRFVESAHAVAVATADVRIIASCSKVTLLDIWRSHRWRGLPNGPQLMPCKHEQTLENTYPAHTLSFRSPLLSSTHQTETDEIRADHITLYHQEPRRVYACKTIK